jgi:hypothetical protein
MYIENERKTGFWIRRWSWERRCAKVTEVAELTGKPPYYNNPKIFVDFYDIETGKPRDRHQELSCAGNYTYIAIDEPRWPTETIDAAEQSYAKNAYHMP